MGLKKAFFIIISFFILSSVALAETTKVTSLFDYFNDDLSKWTIKQGKPVIKDSGVYLPFGMMHAQSTQAHGVWEFVLFTDYKGNIWEENHVGFIVNNIDGDVWYNGYGIGYNEKGLSFFRLDGKDRKKTVLFTKYILDSETEKSIKITRDLKGLFKIYLNGRLFKEINDDTYKTSNYFVFCPLSDNVGYIGGVNVYQEVSGSCNDKIMNPWEEGIDCGGPCDPCIKNTYSLCFLKNNICEIKTSLKLKEEKQFDIAAKRYSFKFNRTDDNKIWLNINDDSFLWIDNEEYFLDNSKLELIRTENNYMVKIYLPAQTYYCPENIRWFDLTPELIGVVDHEGKQYLLCNYNNPLFSAGLEIVNSDDTIVIDKYIVGQVIKKYSWKSSLDNFSKDDRNVVNSVIEFSTSLNQDMQQPRKNLNRFLEVFDWFKDQCVVFMMKEYCAWNLAVTYIPGLDNIDGDTSYLNEYLLALNLTTKEVTTGLNSFLDAITLQKDYTIIENEIKNTLIVLEKLNSNIDVANKQIVITSNRLKNFESGLVANSKEGILNQLFESTFLQFAAATKNLRLPLDNTLNLMSEDQECVTAAKDILEQLIDEQKTVEANLIQQWETRRSNKFLSYFVFFILFFLLLVYFKTKKQKNKINMPKRKKCSKCGVDIKIKSRYCYNCGARLKS